MLESDASLPYDYSDFVDYLTTIERETATRFPRAAREADLFWEMALNNVNGYISSGKVDYFLQAVETELNSGEVEAPSLQEHLKQRGFEASATYPAVNLFGDGRSATVFHVIAGYDGASMVLILTGSLIGEYRLLSVQEHWTSLWHQDEGVVVTDRNGNGQPEIQVIDTSYGTGLSIGTCVSQLSLHEWRGLYPEGRFVNLARSIAYVGISGDGECYKDFWEFSPPEANGVQHIISVMRRRAGGYSSPCTDYELRTIYAWTGSVYEWDGETANMPSASDPPWCAVLWADWAGGLNDKAVVLVNAWLQTWPTEIDKLLGPSAQDYFRLKLGTWYALRGETERAQTILRMVRDYPAYPESTIASQMAGAYLENYEAGLNPVGACGAVYRTIENAQLEIPPSGGLESAQGWPYNVCDLEISFQKTIFTFTPHDIPELINWLGTHQVAVWVVKQADLNDDGVEDWVALLKMPASRAWRLWALIRDEKGLNAIIAQDYFWPKESFSATLMHLQPYPDSPHINIFTLDNNTAAFQIIERQGKLHATPFPLSELPAKYQPMPSPAEKQDQTIERIEQALFDSDNAPEALGPLQSLLAGDIIEFDYSPGSDEPDRVRPRLFYLLGLAYELSSNAREAVQAYWQLWHDYPDNPYTLMARRKLEAITP